MIYLSPEIAGAPERILAFVLAGGRGAGMQPLTASHAKAALPFGKSLRLVDFVLSNLVNSGIDSIYLLAQHKPESLIEHVHGNWRLALNGHDRFVSVVLPRREHGGYFRGTADAVYQNLALIERHAPDIVAVFAADHVYRMDVRQMVHFHRECGADVTVATAQVPIHQASSFDIAATGYKGEIRDLQQKPDWPVAIPACPEFACASMGNYLFDTGVLVESLEQALRRGETGIGEHVLPRLIHSHQVHAYDFASNSIPGLQPHEEQAYWRDMGTLETYVAAHCDILGNVPLFNLQNPHWPIGPTRSAPQRAPGAGDAQYAEICSDHQMQRTGSGFANCCALKIGTA